MQPDRCGCDGAVRGPSASPRSDRRVPNLRGLAIWARVYSQVLLYLAMLQNRLYFVFVARQPNAIRGYLIKVAAEWFEKNQMYTSTNFPALKL